MGGSYKEKRLLIMMEEISFLEGWGVERNYLGV